MNLRFYLHPLEMSGRETDLERKIQMQQQHIKNLFEHGLGMARQIEELELHNAMLLREIQRLQRIIGHIGIPGG